jgi:hypothetical protein
MLDESNEEEYHLDATPLDKEAEVLRLQQRRLNGSRYVRVSGI